MSPKLILEVHFSDTHLKLPIQAIERHASAWMRPKLPFAGSFADWADVEHAFGRTASITDKEIQWDWQSELKRELEDPMAPLVRAMEARIHEIVEGWRAEEQDQQTKQAAKADTTEDTKEASAKVP